MEAACYVLRRDDTMEYYCGSFKSDFNARWSGNISKAKKYKRKCDASNAATLMLELKYPVDPEKMSILVFGMTCMDSYPYKP